MSRRTLEPPTSGVRPPTDTWRLLAGWSDTGRVETYAEHVARFGELPLAAYHGSSGRVRLIETVSASGLRGRGGAAFPTGRKLATVAGGRGRAVVVGNGCEGEPSSRKDRILAEYAPHLVVEGALVAAHATHADEVHLCMHEGAPPLRRLAEAAAAHHSRVKVRVLAVPGGFVASEESALVNFLNKQDSRPTSKPPRVFESGVKGRPTYVGNFESLAHLALIARFGPEWFRSAGTAESPGTALVTVDGAVRHPGVVEVPYGMPLAEVLDAAGGASGELQALLVGGYAGHWLPASALRTAAFSHSSLAAAGASVGVGSVIALPAQACGFVETALVLRYLAAESAKQCGPCMFGLPAIAEDFAALATGAAVRDAAVVRRVQRRLGEINGRGACAHPDGAVRLADSALKVFDADLRQHLAGRPCLHARSAPRLPLLQPGQGVVAAR
jgi:NADH:ubiquinone oxidoreductase subunit F (NADH-binding)